VGQWLPIFSLKQGNALLRVLFNFAIEYAIRKAKENRVGPKLNGTYHLLAYADDVNLLGDNIDTIKNNTENSIGDTKEVGLETSIEKTKFMLLSHHQDAGQNPHIKIANKSLENVAQFKYLEMIVTDPNLIRKKIKKLNLGIAFYHRVQNYSSFCCLRTEKLEYEEI
jgi:hypothetical protein